MKIDLIDLIDLIFKKAPTPKEFKNWGLGHWKLFRSIILRQAQDNAERSRSIKVIRIIRNLVVFTFYFLLFTFSARSTWAENISSDNYEVQISNLNMTGDNKSSTNYNLLDTVGQTAPGKYERDGFIIKAGFPYVKTIIPFAFTISDLSIDFGSLVPETSNLQANTLTVSSDGAAGYSVVVFENNPLRSFANSSITIPDTTCNDGDETCDETVAKLWDDNSTYGFGFNMSGDDVSADFSDSNHYRQFANNEANETTQEIMASNSVDSSRNATVTYKINISPLQSSGQYENGITFIATPGY